MINTTLFQTGTKATDIKIRGFFYIFYVTIILIFVAILLCSHNNIVYTGQHAF